MVTLADEMLEEKGIKGFDLNKDFMKQENVLNRMKKKAKSRLIELYNLECLELKTL